jgi:hypothetical protein
MSKFKDFIRSRKVKSFKKALVEDQVPSQGSFVTLYKNEYKVLTKADSKICILEDIKSNKIAIPAKELLKVLKDQASEDVEKAVYGEKPKTLVRTIGENAKSKASSGGTPGKQADPVGTIRNGRKKVISKRTGEAIWVNVGTGESHASHDSKDSLDSSKEAKQQSDTFFASLKDKLHPSDQMRLQREMGDLLKIKQRISNSLEVAHHDDKTKSPEAFLSRKRVLALQDEYKAAFKKFSESIKSSVAKNKKGAENE